MKPASNLTKSHQPVRLRRCNLEQGVVFDTNGVLLLDLPCPSGSQNVSNVSRETKACQALIRLHYNGLREKVYYETWYMPPALPEDVASASPTPEQRRKLRHRMLTALFNSDDQDQLT